MTDTLIEELRDELCRLLEVAVIDRDPFTNLNIGSQVETVADAILAIPTLADRLSAQAGGGEAGRVLAVLAERFKDPRYSSQIDGPWHVIKQSEYEALVSTYDHGKRDGIEAGAVRDVLQAVRDCRKPPHKGESVHGPYEVGEAWSISGLTKLLPAIDRALSGEGREVAEDTLAAIRTTLRPYVAEDDLDTVCDALTALATPEPQIAPEMEPIPDSEEG